MCERERDSENIHFCRWFIGLCLCSKMATPSNELPTRCTVNTNWCVPSSGSVAITFIYLTKSAGKRKVERVWERESSYLWALFNVCCERAQITNSMHVTKGGEALGKVGSSSKMVAAGLTDYRLAANCWLALFTERHHRRLLGNGNGNSSQPADDTLK